MVMISQVNFSSTPQPQVLSKNRTQSVYFGQTEDTFETSDKKEKHFWQEHPYLTAFATAGIIGLAAILTKGHLWGKVEKAASKAIEKPPLPEAEKIKLEALAKPHFQEAVEYSGKDIARAEKAINKAIEIYPEKGEFYCCKGVLFEAMDKPQEALKEYEKSMQLDPKEPKGFFNAANLLQEENPQKAYDYLKRAMAINSEDMDFAHLDHILRDKLGIEEPYSHTNKKIDFLYKQIEKTPNDPQLHLEMAKEYERMNDPEGAAKTYIKLTELLPDDPTNFSKVSIYRKKQEHFDEALDYCNKAIALDPKNHLEHFNKSGIIVRMNGDMNEALKAINKAIKLNGNDSKYYDLKADILKSKKAKSK